MTKKRILYGFLGLLVLYLCYLAYIFILSPKTNLQSIYLIPKDAVFIIESEQPVESWEKISKGKTWRHLKKNAYFSDLTENIQRVDTVFNDNHKLFEFFDNRSLFISVHMISHKDYGIFYVLDLKRIAKLQLLKTYLNTLLDDGYVLSKRIYHEHEILEVHDRESKKTMYLSFIKNQLVASYTHTLVEASIDQYLEPVLGRNLNFLKINQKVGHEDLFRMYVQYHYFDDYIKMYSDRPSDWVKRVSENFLFSGFYFDLDENSTLTANGYTNISGVNEYYLEALQKSGTAKRSVPEVAPNSTALYISYGFDSFAEFYKNFEMVQQNDPEQFESYQTSIAKMEKFLKIDVKEHFVSWIGNEIAVLQIQSHINKSKNDVALVLKANDAEVAKKNLTFVVEQIRKKTPVKFKAVNYKDYEINFLSIKGFFKMLLGGRFDEFDKPYFTQIDDFVIFSDSPNTLKGIINKVSEGDILATSEEFKSFDERFDSESSVFVYSNVPLLFDNMYALADAPTKQKMLKNKDFIICFPQVGLQLSPEDDLFESRLVLNYRKVEEVKRTFKTSTSVNKAIPKKQASASTEITDTVFNLKPIYPTDLNAKSFRKQYTNGNTRFEVDLKDGLKHGRYEEFYSDGTRKIRGRFRDDEQVGTWRYYDKEGTQVLKKRF